MFVSNIYRKSNLVNTSASFLLHKLSGCSCCEHLFHELSLYASFYSKKLSSSQASLLSNLLANHALNSTSFTFNKRYSSRVPLCDLHDMQASSSSTRSQMKNIVRSLTWHKSIVTWHKRAMMWTQDTLLEYDLRSRTSPRPRLRQITRLQTARLPTCIHIPRL